MRKRVAVDLSGMSVYSQGSDGLLYWGFWGILAIETTVFAGLVASYFYLRFESGSWPPGGHSPPDLLLPTINTGILLLSSVSVAWGDRGIEKGDSRRLALGLLGGVLLAALFLVLKVVEYADSDYRWDSHAYGSIVWTIVGFHSAHVLTLVMKTTVIDVLAWRGYFNERRRLGATVNGIYWHFVVLVWIPLFLTLYISPRL
jgi:cytochrome c oxidase subunit III